MLSLRHNMSKIVKLTGNGVSFDEIVNLAVKLLKEGKIIALPTDTLYGVATLAQNTEAVDAMCRIKRRDNGKKNIAICVGSIEDIPKWGKVLFPQTILSDLLPGPVTLVLERKSNLNPCLNPSISTIGIRIPKSKFIQDVASACGEPLALTSANISTTTSTLAVQEFKDMWPSLDLVVDGGILGQCDPHRLGSTVVDLSVKGFFKVIRNGCSLERTLLVLERHGLKMRE